ncbi:hypothetical protein CHLRE_11g475050v5 [Chlamydomonas reinhardtii]|uniref:Uncharacterized protein n=1 Tax=Chlamydomonas reinhardtii TaxID=3055 RepID=A0A2K3D898_CHLRE|nr:uncharacterized protein CHLRE_11g475050v5 [Chlamydomonas reinhardtii]PNW76761.1 hypothetical protein CHLRE_11g475050v5 [Chlamydomonas reinhardtii]
MSRQIKDLESFERKVRPIYDALDSRNWKGALKLCQQALQKYPENELIKVLKAIGLDRSGKREEANQIVDEVVATTPIDEQVLRLAAMVLRGSGRLAAITSMYEAAAAAAAAHGPGQAELAQVLLNDVFGAHVRESNFVKQQQVAMKLSKASGPAAGAAGVSSERYSWWVVLSLLLQARAALRARASGQPAPPGQVPAIALEPEKMLALAEGMMSRQASKDKKLEGYEAFMVYVDVLLAQGKIAEALALVTGPLGESCIRLPAERLQLRAVLAALSGDLQAAAEALAEGLRLNPDDWGALLLLLDCLLPGTVQTPRSGASADAPQVFTPQHPLILISGGLAEQLPPRGAPLPTDGGATDEAFQRAEGLIKELQAVCTESPTSTATPSSPGQGGDGKPMIMRGPDLALVDLALRRHRAAGGGGGDTEANAVVDAVLDYFRKYGHLVSCAVDLRTYVAALGPAASERLAAGLAAEVEAAVGTAGAGEKKDALKVLRRQVCAAQLRDELGLPRLEGRGPEAAVEAAREFMTLYATARPLQEDLDSRERGAADELPALAAAALVSAAGAAASDAEAVPFMLAAYGTLADALRDRPYGAAMRIAAAELAALLAAPAAAAAHVYKLDVKHIQLDTLASHLLLPPLLTWPSAAPPPPAGPAAQAPGEAAPASSGSGSSASPLLTKALSDSRALFEDHGRDAGETLFTAYTHGMYTKVLEFNAFRERLAAAHTFALVRAESAIADSLLRGAATNASSSGASGSASTSDAALSADAISAAALAAVKSVRAAGLPDTDSLRFNWDLTTRPTWSPPCTAGPNLQPLQWWGSRPACARGQEYGRRWWSAPSSSEAAVSEAGAWRAAQAAAVAHRWLLPHCIAGALGASGPEVLELREAVGQLQALLDVPAASGSAPAAGAALCDERAVRRLDVQLYRAALAVQEELHQLTGATNGADAAPPESSASCSVALAEAVAAIRGAAEAATSRLSTEAAAAEAWGGVLPGGALAQLAHLLREPMTVLAACLQSYQAALKALQKKRGKAAGGQDGHLQKLAADVAAASEELTSTARACGDTLSSLKAAAAGRASSATEALLRFLQERGAGPFGDGARAALTALAREQELTLAALAQAAVAVAKLAS